MTLSEMPTLRALSEAATRFADIRNAIETVKEREKRLSNGHGG
jgi:hypothetical protein